MIIFFCSMIFAQIIIIFVFFFFFSSRRRHTRFDCDWSSDVCSSDLNPPFYKWFPGAQLNASYLCLDRHVRSWRKNKVAIIWEGEPTENGAPTHIRKLTYQDVYRDVNRIAHVLREKYGIRKGGMIGFYLPMIPEFPVFMLAAARLGACFTVIFSGFSADSLADRLADADAKLLVTADGGRRRG